MENKFVIFSSGYNCKSFVEKNIQSVKNQSYKNFKHIIVDDASTDNTYKKIMGIDPANAFVYSNILNKGWLGNAVKYLDPIIEDDDIIIILDLDDWFYDNNVLEKLNNIYNKKDCWTTYGTLIRSDDGKSYYNTGYPNNIIETRAYRKYKTWKWQALRTFKGFLWNSIKTDDLKTSEGDYAAGAYDRAIGYPILEMTPPEKNIYIPDILMVYNRNRKLNLDKVNRKKQRELCSHFQSLPPYDLLRR